MTITLSKQKEGGAERYYIKPHDLEDFKYIIDNYGTEWSHEQ